jgi:hypothetical protein
MNCPLTFFNILAIGVTVSLVIDVAALLLLYLDGRFS